MVINGAALSFMRRAAAVQPCRPKAHESQTKPCRRGDVPIPRHARPRLCLHDKPNDADRRTWQGSETHCPHLRASSRRRRTRIVLRCRVGVIQRLRQPRTTPQAITASNTEKQFFKQIAPTNTDDGTHAPHKPGTRLKC